MTIFRKTLQVKACQASKGITLTGSFFITREIITSMATKLFTSLKISFVYQGNRNFK